MKRIYIVRHAEAEGSVDPKKDFERKLSTQGRYDAQRMGDMLRERNTTVTLMLSSLASRAFTTCTIIAAKLGYGEKKIQGNKYIYGADVGQLMAVVGQVNERHSAVMLFGHNPACTMLANKLLGGYDMRLPTCGVVAADLNIQSWKDIGSGCGQMVFFEAPKARW